MFLVQYLSIFGYEKEQTQETMLKSVSVVV